MDSTRGLVYAGGDQWVVGSMAFGLIALRFSFIDSKNIQFWKVSTPFGLH